ncbi:MAG: kinase/pyrophosphorylase, partial [Planctomycetota bacterium]
IILYTLVSPNARRSMRDAGQELLVETIDVLGPVLTGLNTLINRPPRATPGLYYESERDYFDRVDAIDYTLKHDDGQRPDQLGQADVVLVGVSRASKSSTCFYLAYRGVFAANVPLLPGHSPPRELTQIDPRRVIGLTVNCRRLHAVRLARAHAFGTDDIGSYLDQKAIADEVREVHELMARHKWRRIDVSHLAIEEIAREVMRLMDEADVKRRKRRRRSTR